MPRPGPPSPRWGPKGPDLGRADVACVTAPPHRQGAASSSSATRATPSRAPPPSERREPEAAGRGEPRATSTSSRVEARPPPPAPHRLSPAACADSGGGRGGGEGEAVAAAGDFAPTTARGGRCGALSLFRCSKTLGSIAIHRTRVFSNLLLRLKWLACCYYL
jgi:hypothetical protein